MAIPNQLPNKSSGDRLSIHSSYYVDARSNNTTSALRISNVSKMAASHFNSVFMSLSTVAGCALFEQIGATIRILIDYRQLSGGIVVTALWMHSRSLLAAW